MSRSQQLMKQAKETVSAAGLEVTPVERRYDVFTVHDGKVEVCIRFGGRTWDPHPQGYTVRIPFEGKGTTKRPSKAEDIPKAIEAVLANYDEYAAQKERGDKVKAERKETRIREVREMTESLGLEPLFEWDTTITTGSLYMEWIGPGRWRVDGHLDTETLKKVVKDSSKPCR